MNLFDLSNKIAIVTGANGLLGIQHCLALSESGATIIAVDLNDNHFAAISPHFSSPSYFIKTDITNKKSIEQLLEFIKNKFGKVDILINNAAINDKFEDPQAALNESKFENYPLDKWQLSLDVNLTGTFLMSQIIGSYMAEKKSGCIINIASTYGIVAPNQELYKDENGLQVFYKPPAYSVTKAAVIALTKYLAAYWGKSGIRVNSLSPGGVFNDQADFFVIKYSEKTPLNRMANSSDFRGAIIFLASDASAYITGENLVVDGGFTIW